MKSGKLKYLLPLLMICFQIRAQGKMFVNQIGYLPQSEKIVVGSTGADSFYVVDVQTGKRLLTKAFSKHFVNDPLSGMDLKVGDFSEFKTEGRFRIEDNIGNESFEFAIGKSVFNDLARTVQKAYYFQRCGTALTMNYAGKYFRNACHQADGYFHSTTGKKGFHYAVGGWHDAGDFGKYIVNAGVTVGTLLLAYELFPEYFSADDLNIPESGNGVPDLLDEIRYELEWELKMQDTSGGVFTKLTPKNFAPFVMPDQDDSKRFVYQISSAATADFCAVSAKAARIFSPFDSAFSSQCEKAASLAWQYLVNHPDIVPPGGFRNPSDTFTGEYGDSNDRDERLWAAIEMFASIGDSSCLNYYLHNVNSVGLFKNLNWRDVSDLAHLTYLTLSHPDGDLTKTMLKTSLSNFAEEIKIKTDNNGFGINIKNGEFYWGSNSMVLNNALLLIADEYFNKRSENFSYTLKALNYILGLNPLNQSFVSGFGTKRLMHPHHRQSASDDVSEPVPGLLAGGPNQYLNDPTLQSLFTTETPPALCYIDSVSSYASNEVAINWNAPLVFVAGYLNGKGVLTSVQNIEKKSLNLNSPKIKLLQNYPNPLVASVSSVANIEYHTSISGNVNVDFYNILGENITHFVAGNNLPGNYTIKLNLSDFNLTSGIYFITLRINNFSDTRKVLYLR